MPDRSNMFGGFESLMYGGSDPLMFGAFDPFTRAITDGTNERRMVRDPSEQRDRHRRDQRAVTPRDSFGNANSMMNYMQNMFSNMHGQLVRFWLYRIKIIVI